MQINPNIRYLNSFAQEMRYVLGQRSPLRYMAHRLRWNYAARLHWLGDFPDHVDIETCSVCQMRCPMCFQTVRDDVVNGMMDMELFKSLMRQVAEHKPYSIRLSWRGECLLHPRFSEMLDHAREVYSGNISFITNGLNLDDALFEQLIARQIDYIVISADGLGPTYNAVRAPGDFSGLVKKLTTLRDMKRQKGTRFPMVRINGVSLWFTETELAQFRQTFAPLTDKILVGGVLNNFQALPPRHDPNRVCASPWQRLLVSFSGTVHPCCDDYLGLYSLGDATQQPLAAIWRGHRAQAIRRLMREQRRLENPLCRAMDCGIDENANEHDDAFMELMRERVRRGGERQAVLLPYLRTKTPCAGDRS